MRRDSKKRPFSGKRPRIGPCALFLAAACDSGAAAVPPERLGAHEVELEGVVLDRFAEGRLTERVRLARAWFDRRSTVARGEEAEILVFGSEAPDVRFRASSRSARVSFGERRVEMEGGVSIADAGGRVLTTERLTYDVGADLVRSEGPVTATGANFRAEGGALRGHPKAGAVEVAGPVSAILYERSPR